MKAFWNIENIDAILLCRFLFTVNGNEGNPWIIQNHFKFSIIIIYHLTFLGFFNMVFLTCVFLLTRFVNSTCILAGHLHWYLLTRLVGCNTGKNVLNVRLTIYVGFHIFQEVWSPEFTSRVMWLIKSIFREPWWDLYLSLIFVCQLMFVIKQTIPEISCTKRTVVEFLHDTSLIWIISGGVKLWLVYFGSLPIHVCIKIYHILSINMIVFIILLVFIILMLSIW